MLIDPVRMSGKRLVPDHQALFWNSLDEHNDHVPKLAMLFGQPLVYCAGTGDVLALSRQPNVPALSLIPSSERAPDLLGPPVGFRHRLGFIETGPNALQVGRNRLVVWRAHRITDALWSPEPDGHRTVTMLSASDLGLAEFLECYGWVSEDRFVVAGFKPNQSGEFGIVSCRVRLATAEGKTRLEVKPDQPIWFGTGTTNSGEWHGLVIPEEGHNATIIVANLCAIWTVRFRGSLEERGQAFTWSGDRPVKTQVLASLSKHVSSYLCLTSWPRERYEGLPFRRIDRLDARGDGEMEHTPVITEPVEWARILRTAGTVLLVAAREDQLVLVRDFANLSMGDWATLKPPQGHEVLVTTAGPDYIAAMTTDLDGRLLLQAAPVVRSQTDYVFSEGFLNLKRLRENLCMEAAPSSVCVLQQGEYRLNAHVFPIRL